MDKKNYTIYDVAEKVGVSLATVSRVINNSGNVKESTRKKIQEVIDETGYRPNQVARGLALKKTATIGIFINNLSDNFMNELADGIIDVAKMYDYEVNISTGINSKEDFLNLLEKSETKFIDGLIFIGENFFNTFSVSNKKTSIPIVIAGGLDQREQLYGVDIDEEKAFYEVSEILRQKGSEKLFFVDSIEENKKSLAKLLGITKKFEDANILYTQNSFDGGYKIGDHIINSKNSGIIFSSDEAAVGFLDFLIDNGYKVPEDFQIFTGQNTNLSKIARPSLSTISIPKYDIGAVAMRTLTKLMNDESSEKINIYLPFDLILRNSIKKG